MKSMNAEEKVLELEGKLAALQKEIGKLTKGRRAEPFLDERQKRIIRNCQEYAWGDPAGLTGHNEHIVVALLTKFLEDHCLTEEQYKIMIEPEDQNR